MFIDEFSNKFDLDATTTKSSLSTSTTEGKKESNGIHIPIPSEGSLSFTGPSTHLQFHNPPSKNTTFDMAPPEDPCKFVLK